MSILKLFVKDIFFFLSALIVVGGSYDLIANYHNYHNVWDIVQIVFLFTVSIVYIISTLRESKVKAAR